MIQTRHITRLLDLDKNLDPIIEVPKHVTTEPCVSFIELKVPGPTKVYEIRARGIRSMTVSRCGVYSVGENLLLQWAHMDGLYEFRYVTNPGCELVSRSESYIRIRGTISDTATEYSLLAHARNGAHNKVYAEILNSPLFSGNFVLDADASDGAQEKKTRHISPMQEAERIMTSQYGSIWD